MKFENKEIRESTVEEYKGKPMAAGIPYTAYPQVDSEAVLVSDACTRCTQEGDKSFGVEKTYNWYSGNHKPSNKILFTEREFACPYFSQEKGNLMNLFKKKLICSIDGGRCSLFESLDGMQNSKVVTKGGKILTQEDLGEMYEELGMKKNS